MAPPGKSSRLDAISLNQGLNDVYLPPGGAEDPNNAITIDIVAVAGLGAVPGKTWTSNENGVRVNWLQDSDTMLPKRFPTARIMEFEYPSKYYGEGAVSQTLQKVAEALLTALTIKRKGCSRRPIIFIAHCLGGLVVEKAICLAKARMDEYKAVFNAIAGVVFLATPFQGTKAELKAAVLNDILNVIGNGSDSDLLPLLEYKSPRLKELLDEFGRILNETRLSTYCFFETQKSDLSHLVLPKRWGKWPSMKEKIVTEESAILPGRNEMSAYLERDHFKINKFTGAQDGAYVVVQNELGKMIRNAGVFVKGRLQDSQRSLVPDDKYEEIKKQLAAFDEDGVLNQVKKARPDMFQKGAKAPCSFLLESQEWKQWLQPARQGPEALWIRGKKGQGKTLFAIDVIEKHKVQCSQESVDGQNFFAYGFCDGSKPDTSSAVNLLRVILRQLIVQKRDLARHFLKGSKSKESAAHTVPSLIQQLLKISNDPTVGTIYIVIDGIDYLSRDSARSDLLYEISQLLQAKTHAQVPHDDYDNRSDAGEQPYHMIKFLILSNTLNDDIAESLKDQALIDLTDDKYKKLVDQGISEDFSQRIVEFSRRRKYGPPSEYIMKSFIKSKAQSEPAWVSLACGEIEALEVPKSKIRGYLEALPAGTSALFKRIMDRILDKGDDEIEVTKELFRCLLLAKWAPNIDELAVMAGFSDDERADRALLHNYVSQCAPFVILNPDSDMVEFAMPEIQELFENYAGEILFPSESSKKFQHGLIALRCFDYLLNNISSTELVSADSDDGESGEAEDDTEPSSDKVFYAGPMEITYAQEYWLDHAKEAEIDMLNSLDLQSSFWDPSSVMRENWWTAYTEVYDDFEGLSGMSSLHLAAFFGFDALLDRLLEQGKKVELETEDSWGNRPLYWAARRGHEDTVKILLRAGATVDGHGEGLTALHGAAMQGHAQIVDELLQHGANVNFYHSKQGSPLFQACTNNYSSIARTLIEAGADANLGSNAHTTPLQGAIWSSQVELVRTILDHGVLAEYDASKTFSFTPLWSASDWGYTDIVDLLLTRGANVNWTGQGFGNPLSAACQKASVDTVRRLLGANPNATCQQEALKEAVWSGSTDIVALLLEHNPRLQRDEAFVRASSTGDNKILQLLAANRAPIAQRALDESLYFASDNELRDTVKLLLSLRANPSARGSTYGSALGAACFDGSYDIVKALVDSGADVNQIGGEYGTPLQAASYRGSLPIVQLLLSKGASPNNHISGQYATPLQAAAVAGSEEIVRVMLDHGADINAVGGFYGTALLAAANCRHPEVLKLLVERGADVNIVSEAVNEGEPALQVAAYALAAENVQLLLDHGAEVDKVDNVGYTSLMAAAAAADSDAVEMLLARDADVHLVDNQGDSPIISAVRGGNLAICRRFIDMGADLNCVNKDGSTPLMEAVQWDNLELCELLVEQGAEVGKVTHHERGTALHQVCFRGNSPLFKFLCEKGADVNAEAGIWGTCLQASVLRASNEFITEVLDAGADINATAGKYQTALAAAAYALSGSAADLLLERGANANITGGFYGSALGSAAAKGWTTIIDKLLTRTSPAIVNDALSQAILYRRADAVDKLLENGAKINVSSGKYSTAAKALDESFQPHSNSDDEPVFEGYSVQTDDAGDFAQADETDDEAEQSKEEFFKSYYGNEFVARPKATRAPATPKPVENVKLKTRETTIKTLLAKASQNTRNLDATVEPGARGFGNRSNGDGTSRGLPHRTNGDTTMSEIIDVAKGLFSRKSGPKTVNGDYDNVNRGYDNVNRDYDANPSTYRQQPSSPTAASYGAAALGTGAVAGAAVGVASHGFDDDEQTDRPHEDYAGNDYHQDAQRTGEEYNHEEEYHREQEHDEEQEQPDEEEQHDEEERQDEEPEQEPEEDQTEEEEQQENDEEAEDHEPQYEEEQEEERYDYGEEEQQYDEE